MGKSGSSKRLGGRLNREDSAQLTAKIVDVAVDLFTEVGFAATTIEEIASRCETTPRSVTRRFPTKEDLLIATVPRFTQRQNRFRSDANDEPNALLALKKLLRFFLDLAVSPELRSFRITCVNQVRHLPKLAEVMAMTEADWEAEIRSCLERAQNEGLFQGYSAAVLSSMAIATMLSYPMIMSEMSSRKFATTADADVFFDDIFELLLAFK